MSAQTHVEGDLESETFNATYMSFVSVTLTMTCKFPEQYLQANLDALEPILKSFWS